MKPAGCVVYPEGTDQKIREMAHESDRPVYVVAGRSRFPKPLETLLMKGGLNRPASRQDQVEAAPIGLMSAGIVLVPESKPVWVKTTV